MCYLNVLSCTLLPIFKEHFFKVFLRVRKIKKIYIVIIIVVILLWFIEYLSFIIYTLYCIVYDEKIRNSYKSNTCLVLNLCEVFQRQSHYIQTHITILKEESKPTEN